MEITDRFGDARRLFEELVPADDFPEFLAVPASAMLDRTRAQATVDVHQPEL